MISSHRGKNLLPEGSKFFPFRVVIIEKGGEYFHDKSLFHLPCIHSSYGHVCVDKRDSLNCLVGMLHCVYLYKIMELCGIAKTCMILFWKGKKQHLLVIKKKVLWLCFI